MQAELHQTDLPAGGEYIWGIYGRLRARKGGNGFGPLPLEWPDIAAFCLVNGMRLTAWEVGALEAVDDVFMTQAAARIARANKEATKKQ